MACRQESVGLLLVFTSFFSGRRLTRFAFVTDEPAAMRQPVRFLSAPAFFP